MEWIQVKSGIPYWFHFTNHTSSTGWDEDHAKWEEIIASNIAAASNDVSTVDLLYLHVFCKKSSLSSIYL